MPRLGTLYAHVRMMDGSVSEDKDERDRCPAEDSGQDLQNVVGCWLRHLREEHFEKRNVEERAARNTLEEKIYLLYSNT